MNFNAFFGGGGAKSIILKSLECKIYGKESRHFLIILIYLNADIVEVKQEGLCKNIHIFSHESTFH